MLHNAAQCCTVLYSPAQGYTVLHRLHSAAQCCTVLHSAAQCCTVRQSALSAQYSLCTSAQRAVHWVVLCTSSPLHLLHYGSNELFLILRHVERVIVIEGSVRCDEEHGGAQHPEHPM